MVRCWRWGSGISIMAVTQPGLSQLIQEITLAFLPWFHHASINFANMGFRYAVQCEHWDQEGHTTWVKLTVSSRSGRPVSESLLGWNFLPVSVVTMTRLWSKNQLASGEILKSVLRILWKVKLPIFPEQTGTAFLSTWYNRHPTVPPWNLLVTSCNSRASEWNEISVWTKGIVYHIIQVLKLAISHKNGYKLSPMDPTTKNSSGILTWTLWSDGTHWTSIVMFSGFNLDFMR